MILAIMNVANPLYEFLILPIGFIALGWFCNSLSDKYLEYEANRSQPNPTTVRLLFPPEDTTPELYDWQNDPYFSTEEQ